MFVCFDLVVLSGEEMFMYRRKDISSFTLSRMFLENEDTVVVTDNDNC